MVMVVVPVLCVPRSGSSMVAGILHALGVDMGRHMIPPSRWCPLGHFEDRQFVGLHRVMTFAHGDPRRAGLSLPAECTQPPPALASRYRRAVAARMAAVGGTHESRDTTPPGGQDPPPGAGHDASRRAWGIKDPRLAFCFEHFLDCIGPDADVRLVATRRDPRASADSLVTMFGFVPSAAAEVVGGYRAQVAGILARWRGPLLEVDYDAALADPGGAVDRLADFVGRPATPAAMTMVEPRLRRHGGVRA